LVGKGRTFYRNDTAHNHINKHLTDNKIEDKQTQFIVSAKSPLIVQSTPLDANIVLLKREGDQVIIHNNKDEEQHQRRDDY